MRITLHRTGKVLLFCALFPAAPVDADPIIFQSAIQRPANPGGTAVFDRQFVGAKFFVDAPTETTRIGGHFTKTLDIFGAVVRLSSAADFPDSADLSTPDVLGAARIVSFGPDFEIGTDFFSTELSVPLERGWHALVFGSGLFGTVNSSWGGSLPTDHQRLGNPRFFLSGGLDPGSTYQNMRILGDFAPLMFVEGTAAPASSGGPELRSRSGLILQTRTTFPRWERTMFLDSAIGYAVTRPSGYDRAPPYG